MQSLGCMWIEDSRKNNLQSKEGYRGYRQQEALRSLQTDYKAKLHRFWHLLMQIAWPVTFSNFHNAANGHILLNAPDLFWPLKLSRREPSSTDLGDWWEMLRVMLAFDAWWHANSPLLGLQHVHWGCEGSCCCFLRLQSRLVWDVPKALQGRQGMCGSLAGWFQVAIQAVDWFVPEHHLCIGLRCRFCEVLSAFDAWWHANSPLLGATTCPLGVWRLMLLLLAAAKQVGLRCSEGFARSTGDVRQPGRLVSGGYPGRRLVCSRASSMYWFKVSFLRWGPEGLGKLLMLSAKEKGKHLRKLGYI